MYHKSLSVRSYIRYIIVSINSTSSSFIALSILIPYLYLLAITAYSFSISAIVIGIRVGVRVGIRVVVGLKKSGSRFKVRV